MLYARRSAVEATKYWGMTMIYHFDNQRDIEQLQARQVGESRPAPSQQPHMDTDIDQQVERIRWLMQREPMLEGREPLNC
jgi:hypothetical protein